MGVGSREEVFEAISHPLRIKILQLLAEHPMSFSELKKALGVRSSGKLDFHLKKLGDLIALNSNGRYTLTKEGYAALQAITTVKRFGWQKRAYIIGTVTYAIASSYTLFKIFCEGVKPIYVVVLVLVSSWYVFYSYWCIVRRRVFKAY